MSMIREVPPARPGHADADDQLEEEEVVNDSLGTVSTADSTGVDEEKETGEAKDGNLDTRED